MNAALMGLTLAYAGEPVDWGDLPPASLTIGDSTRNQSADPLRMRLGVLLSGMVDTTWQPAVDACAHFTDARLALVGEIGEQWQMVVQGDFALADQAVVDGRAIWSPSPLARLQLGLFKVPVSAELLIPDALIDFNNRARIVDAVAPGRSVGAELDGRIAGGRLFWRAGAFHGAPVLSAPPGQFLGAMRLGSEIPLGHSDDAGSLVVAINGAAGSETLQMGTSGREVVGADTRLELGHGFVSAEWLMGRFHEPGAEASLVRGYHLTVGYLVRPWLQPLLRWDHLEDAAAETPRDLLIPSIAVALPELPPVQLQVDAEIPVVHPDSVRLVAAGTINF